MKIIIISDYVGWCLDNRAKAIEKYLPEYTFIRRGYCDGRDWEHESLDCDIIHINFTYAITRYYDFIKKHHKKCVITICNERSILNGHGNEDIRKMKELFVMCHTTSVSKRIAELLSIKYIPNGVDSDYFYKYKKPVIGYAGTITPVKNVDIIRQACEELGLELRICDYTGRSPGVPVIPHEQMQDFYMGLDVYVHASSSEGFNNTVIEALSCNVPVLMTKQGIWKELEGYVEFIEPTVESIKKGLLKYCGRKLVEEKFLWKNIIPEYKKLYLEVMNG